MREIIGRAVVDQPFRDSLLKDPESALQGYNLSTEEKNSITAIKQLKFDTLEAELEKKLPEQMKIALFSGRCGSAID